MGIWAGIKHAINSTLGTQDFKPLNELVVDVVQETDVRNKLFVAGDNILYDDTSAVPVGSPLYTTFTPSLNGQINIYFENPSSAGYNIYFAIYENDVLVYEKRSASESFTFSIQAGNVYKFERQSFLSNYGTTNIQLKLSADVKQIGYFTIE